MMPRSESGRIVIEIEPALKQVLYETLDEDRTHLKKWFLENVNNYLSTRGQLKLSFSDNLNFMDKSRKESE